MTRGLRGVFELTDENGNVESSLSCDLEFSVSCNRWRAISTKGETWGKTVFSAMAKLIREVFRRQYKRRRKG